VGRAGEPDAVHRARVRVRGPAGPALAPESRSGQPGAPRGLSVEPPSHPLRQPRRRPAAGAARVCSGGSGTRRGPPDRGDPGRGADRLVQRHRQQRRLDRGGGTGRGARPARGRFAIGSNP
jgi:hypothetical protein